ncbi:MAG: hypothetical protein J3Q66DRAFT_391443, partial [Benniella sp.]
MSLDDLDPRQSMERANFHMDNAWKTKDNKLALVLSKDAESTLSHARGSAKRALSHSHNEDLRADIAAAYHRLSELQGHLKLVDKANASSVKAGKWGWCGQSTSNTADTITPLIPPIQPMVDGGSTVSTIDNDTRSPTRKFKLPDPYGHLENTPQLAYCLSLLKDPRHPKTLESYESKWAEATKGTNEQLRLERLAKDVIREFVRDELKNAKAIAEVICLVPVLDKEDVRDLMKRFLIGIEQSGMLDTQQLEGLDRVLQSASPEYLDADDLTKALSLLDKRLKNTHPQSNHVDQLSMKVSNVMDVMANAQVDCLTPQPESTVDVETPFEGLTTSGDTKKQCSFQTRRDEEASSRPLTIAMPQLESSSLLNKAQNRPDVEHTLGLLREKRKKARGNAVYIQPQAKADVQDSKEAGFPLMEKVREFMKNHQQRVFLLMGDSGAGKST